MVIMEKMQEELISRESIVELVRQWGSSVSDAVLDPACSVFTSPEVDGFIGYRNYPNCVVAYGDPVCSPDDIPKLVKEFQSFCEKENKNYIFLIVSEFFAKWLLNNGASASIEFGEEITMDPFDDPREKTGVNASLVRRKTRHAIKDGVCIVEYTGNDPEMERQIEDVGTEWLQARKGPQIHISHVRLFDDRLGKRWFYSMQANRVTGVLLLNQLKKEEGWLLNHLMHVPRAAGGTPELLVTTVLDIIKKEGCHFVTFGAIPGSSLGEMVGIGRFSSTILKILFQVAHKFFRLGGTKKFWEKFDPKSRKCCLVFGKQGIGQSELMALMKALNVSF